MRSEQGHEDITVIRTAAPDLARQVRALMIVLERDGKETEAPGAEAWGQEQPFNAHLEGCNYDDTVIAKMPAQN